MPPRPYVVLSCAVSLDGYLDDASPARLVLSGAEDLDRVDAERAGCDAVLVGARTVRRDDPRLVVRSAARRAARTRRGLPPSPVKVTLTQGGDLDPAARFFTAGEGGAAGRLVYCATPGLERARGRLAAVATVLDAGPAGDLGAVLADLAGRGVGRLLVEGGGEVLTGLLTAGLADELQLAVAPLFVGDPAAPRFVRAGRFPWTAGRRARLVEARPVGDVALLRYALAPPGPDTGGPHADGPHGDAPDTGGPHADGPHADGPHADGPHAHGPHAHGPHAHGPDGGVPR